jgi:hypothetical protein
MKEFFNLGASTEDDKPERKFEKYIGREVVAKVSPQKMLQKIETDVDDALGLIEDFTLEGGTVADVEGKNVIIETENGTFALPRFCVTLRK